MSKPAKIDLDELKKAVDALFDHLHNGGLKEVQLDQDYYWEIDAKEIHNVTANPTDLTIGSLYTDWEFIKKLAEREHEPVVPHFIKLAALLRYLGDAVREADLVRTPPNR